MIGDRSGSAVHYGWDELAGFDWEENYLITPPER